MNKTMKKILFDTLMTILFVCLMDSFFTGLLLHEIIGLALGFFFLLHKAINWKWIKSVAARFFDSAVKPKTKVMFLIDVLLLFGVSIIIVTGIGISQEVFGLGKSNANLALWSAIHHSAAYSSLILISIHIGLHMEMIIANVRKMFGLTQKSQARAVVARLISVCIMVMGIKSSISQNVVGNLAEPFTIGSLDEQISDHILSEYVPASSSTAQTKITVTKMSTQAVADQTLTDYLSKLICTGCGKRCPLSRPLCSKGETRAAAATTAYYQQNASSSSSKSSSGSSSNSTSGNSSSGSSSSSASGNSSSESTVGFAQDTSDSNSSAPLQPLTDFIPIMGLFIGGTHYVLLLQRKLALLIA